MFAPFHAGAPRPQGHSAFPGRLLLGLFLALPSCALPGGPPMPEIAPEINASLTKGRFALAPGDQIHVSFRISPERDYTATVRIDGWASFTGLDEVQVAGLTLEQLDARLSEAYARIYEGSAADVTLEVPTAGPRNVTVMGEVDTQGQVPIGTDGRLTLVEAIAKAGGYDKYTAHMSSMVLVRWDADEQRQRAWKFDARPEFWDEGDPIFLQPYDLVFIPNTPIDDVGIWVDMYIRRLIPWPQVFIPY